MSRGIGASFCNDKCVRDLVGVFLIRIEQMAKMSLAEDDNVIKILAPSYSNIPVM